MKTTIFGVLLDVTPDQDTVLHRLMRKYGFMSSSPQAPWCRRTVALLAVPFG